jgi:hypothetical protein
MSIARSAAKVSRRWHVTLRGCVRRLMLLVAACGVALAAWIHPGWVDPILAGVTAYAMAEACTRRRQRQGARAEEPQGTLDTWVQNGS